MSYEKSPAEKYMRNEPLVIWTDDNTKLEVFAESGGVASVAGANVARASNAQWIIRVNGVERAGWGEARIDQRLDDVKVNALRWWEKRRKTQ